MTGGLLSIISYGVDDLYLTGAPQITFFKIVYRRHTNFSIESIEVGLKTDMNFNDQYEMIIDRTGDLIGKVYLKIKFPETYFSYSQFGFTSSVDTNLYNPFDIFNIVQQFMEYNTQAYRDVYAEAQVQNSNTQDMLNTIYNDFSGNAAQQALINYNNLLTSELNAPQPNNYASNLLYSSNIYNLYLKYKNISTIPGAEFFSLVKNAFTYSQQCYQYYWLQYSNYHQQININSQNNLKFAWNNNIGHNIIEYADATLGGEQIDRHYGNFFQVNYDLTKTYYMQPVYNELIGNLEPLTIYNETPKPSYFITIPLQFWFNKNIGSSFPLVATEYSDLAIKVKLRNIDQCGYCEQIQNQIYTLEDLWNDKNYKLEISLLVDYIFLDGQERKKFAQSSHEYLIENIQSQTETLTAQSLSINLPTEPINYNIINNIQNYNIKMDLRHPVKQLLWTFQKKIFLDNKGGTLKCIYDSYSLEPNVDIDPLINAYILLNSYKRIDKNVGSAKYYNLVQAYQHDTYIPEKAGIYGYSFSLYPENIQPSSTCNMSRFLGQHLLIEVNGNMFYYLESDIDPDIPQDSIASIDYKYTDVILNIYARTYNLLRISGGFAALAFTFN
jgi:hypothetical protein